MMRALYPRSSDLLRDELRQLAPPFLLTWFRERAAAEERHKHPADWVFRGCAIPAHGGVDDRLPLTDRRRARGGPAAWSATHATAFERRRADSAALAQSWERSIRGPPAERLSASTTMQG